MNESRDAGGPILAESAEGGPPSTSTPILTESGDGGAAPTLMEEVDRILSECRPGPWKPQRFELIVSPEMYRMMQRSNEASGWS